MDQPRTRHLGWRIAGIALLLLVLTAALEHQRIARVVFALGLFTGRDEVENFRKIDDVFVGHWVPRSAVPDHLAAGPALVLPESFRYAGHSDDTARFLADTDTAGLLVIHDDRVVFERYYRGASERSRWIAWSVTKSFTSALVGKAVQTGAIHSIEDPATHYLPELAGSAYDGVRIKDLLQMSSGASWNEDYSDRNSDINRFGRVFALGGSLDEFVGTLKRQYAPGTFNRYNTMDCQVLGMILRRVTGKSMAVYLAETLWEPLGMEGAAYWITDDRGAEFAAGGLNATLRDLAKLGVLYLHGGTWHGKQIIPGDWVKASVTPDAPHLMPGKRASADSAWGYGYQWWVPDSSGAYSAVGIYNQFVYVNPSRGLVIAKISANHAYGLSNDESSYREDEHLAFFKAVESSLGSGPAGGS